MVRLLITNLISFLYNIKVEYIRKRNNSYVFFYNNKFYIFKECYLTNEYLLYINYFIDNRNFLFHTLVKNKQNKFLSSYADKSYILMQVNINVNRFLFINDILELGKYNITYVKKDVFNWVNLWKNKIDQVEYFLSYNYKKINILTLSIINYYIGLAELAIYFFINNVRTEYIPLTLCHRRIKSNFDLYEYYSVDDLVLDHFTRDIGEYIKYNIYSNKKVDFSNYNIIKTLDVNDKNLLISRLLFPSYFFDLFDEYILNDRNFDDFDKYFIYIDCYEDNLNAFISFLSK